MKVQIAPIKRERKPADILVLPCWQKKDKAILASDFVQMDKSFFSFLQEDFTAEPGEVLFSYEPSLIEKRVLLVGLGKDKEWDKPLLRKAFAQATEFCRKKKFLSLNIALPKEFDEDALLAIVDSFCMANYSFDNLKKESLSKASPRLKSVNLLGVDKQKQGLIDRHRELMNSVDLTRDLVNGNADDVRASELVRVAEELCKKHSSLHCRVLRKKELEKEGMGLLLAVNRGAKQEPALIVLEYKGNPKSKESTAILGKGITYDTGGLNLKPTGSMETMKVDMAGAAAVLGIMEGVSALGVKKNVIGVIATAENAIGSDAYKPGDVYFSHSGRSVEISNTDAEGRLVLADALSYVQKNYAPSRIIDLATLTGGIVVAIGEEASGLFSNSQEMIKRLQAAAEKTGERVWPMPLFPEYRKMLNSTIADLKNAATGRKASPCTGAMFLKQFVEKETPWAHLDIAGTAYLSETNPYYPSLATGVGVKLLLSFLEDL